MGLKNFQIKFDNPTETFYPGQNVTGRVIVCIDSAKRIKGIELKLRGEAEVHWTTSEEKTNSDGSKTQETIHFTSAELYFENHINLIPMGETTLPMGEHVYPFSVFLPSNIPSSFEGKHGHIRYTGKAKIDRPWKFDHETKTAFTVIAPLDLNDNEKAKEVVKQECHKHFCCCCCKSGPLEMVVNLPARGYVPGQEIPITIEVDNVSDVNVSQVKCKFRKIVKFTVTSPHKDTKTETYDIETVVYPGVPEGGSETTTKKLKIPALPPTDLKNCGIIDLTYDLKVTAKVDGCHEDLITWIPIIIGSIPLRSFQEQIIPPTEAVPNTAGLGWGAQSPPSTVPSYPPSAYPPPSQPYPSSTQPYPPGTQPYPPSTQPYPPGTQPYPPSTQPYTPGFQPYPPAPLPYPTSTQPYPPSFQPHPAAPAAVQAQPTAPPLEAYPNMPPPTYAECVFGANKIQESQYMQGKQEFAPKYPVYNFKTN